MKRLIVSMLALCAVVAAQGAYVDWQYAVAEPKTGGTDWTSGYTAYLISSSEWDKIKDDVTASGLSSAAVDSSAFYQSGSTKTQVKYSTGKNDTGTARQAVADSGNYYVILANSDGYNIALNNVAVTAYSDPTGAGTGLTPGITIQPGSAVAGSGITFTAFGGGGGGGEGGVPEPTSGLLLLVGGGMLALRRKQK